MSPGSTQDSQHPSKKSRDVVLPSIDRLSNLHESILSHILSKLPTKEGVQTSVLSKDWRYKWTCMYKMELIKFGPRNSTYRERFIKLLETIVSSALGLKSFSLSCDLNAGYELERVKRWIYDIITKEYIESLKLFFWRPSKSEYIVLPWTLLDRPFLNDLTLSFPGCTFHVDPMNSFLKNLKILHLHRVQVVSMDPKSDTLIINFPVLEILKVESCKWGNVTLVKIDAPLLRAYISQIKESEGYSIEIISSNLSTCKRSGGKRENIIVTGSYELKRLIVTDSLLYYPKRLSKLLGIAPLLKFLSINVKSNGISEHYDTGKYNFDELRLMPPCIVFPLEEIELLHFTGVRTQYNLVKFFLKNGEVLKKVSIYGPKSLEEQNKVMRKLSCFPRNSTKLTIVFLKTLYEPSQPAVTFVVDEENEARVV